MAQQYICVNIFHSYGLSRISHGVCKHNRADYRAEHNWCFNKCEWCDTRQHCRLNICLYPAQPKPRRKRLPQPASPSKPFILPFPLFPGPIKLLPQPRRHLQNLPGQTAKYPIKTKYCALTGSKKMLPRTFLARIYVGILLIFVNSFMNDFGKTIWHKYLCMNLNNDNKSHGIRDLWD